MIDFEEIKKWEILALDTGSCYNKSLICIGDKNFEVSNQVAEFFKIIQNSNNIYDIIELYHLSGKYYTVDEIVSLKEKCIDPILKSLDKKAPSSFLFKFELVSSGISNRVAQSLKILFKPIAIAIIVSIITIVEIIFFSHATIDLNFKNEIGIYTILCIYAIFVTSSFFHELGHASACSFMGVKSGGIGFGLYLNFPVLYTDVSGVWRLPRKERFIVNIAGIYFQLIYLIPFIVVYLVTGNTIIKYFVYCINMNFILTLNPFFKFDGYWIISDMLGIPNLRSRINELLLYFGSKIKGNKHVASPFILSLPKISIVFVSVYTLISTSFFCYYFFYIVPIILYKFCYDFPLLLWTFVNNLALGYSFDYNIFKDILVQLIIICLTGYMIYRVTNQIYKSIKYNHTQKKHTGKTV